MWGLLHTDGALTDIQDAPPVGREAEGTAVQVDVILGSPPWRYDSGQLAAVTNTAALHAATTQRTDDSAKARTRRTAERQALRSLPAIARSHADRAVRLIASMLLAQLRENPPLPSDIDPED